MHNPPCDICGGEAAEYEEEPNGTFTLLGCPDCGYDAMEGDESITIKPTNTSPTPAARQEMALQTITHTTNLHLIACGLRVHGRATADAITTALDEALLRTPRILQ